MGMSTYVVGFIPPDEKFHKMLEVYRACEKANIPIPKEVYAFFDDQQPDSNGVEIHLSSDINYKDCLKEWNDDTREGYEVYLDKLPKDIKIIRFVNSW